MRIYYITNARIPTEKAHGLQIVKTCEALSNLSVDIELVVPNRCNQIGQEINQFYNIKKKFRLTRVKSFDWLKFHKLLGASLGFKLQAVFYLKKLASFKLDQKSIIYTRNVEIAWLFARQGHRVFYEAHVWPKSKLGLYKKMLHKTAGVITNSQGTAAKFKANGFDHILVAPNGVDLDKFKIQKPKMQIKEELGLPRDKKIVMYVGHLYRWKGIDKVIEAAALMQSARDIIFFIVGGTAEDLAKYQAQINYRGLENIRLLGFINQHEIPLYLKSADVLLLPNIPSTKESEFYTSPIKMFEYMASGVPIIASDLPSIREVLHAENAYLIPAGDAESMSQKIKDVLAKNNSFITAGALRDVQEFSWHKRAEKILKFIKN